MKNLFARLREETAPEHHELEQRLDLMSPAITRSRYVEVLQQFLGYVDVYERHLQRSVPATLIAFIEPRLRAPLLRDDLAHMGLTQPAIEATPRCPDVPGMATLPAQFGAMYVMEGSTLGGRVIGPHMQKKFGLQPGCGNAYFLGHGEQTGRMWTLFRQTMESTLADAQHGEAIATASASFRALGRWFDSVQRMAA